MGNNIGKFFNTEYKTTAVDRVKQIGEQAAEGAKESAPIILGVQSYIDKHRADAEYKEALKYYNRKDDSITSETLARYAESSAGKNKKWEIDKNVTTNPVTVSLFLGIIFPVIGFIIGIIVLGLRRDFAAKDEARKAKEESLRKYPENNSEISQEKDRGEKVAH